MLTSRRHAYRASLFYFTADPLAEGEKAVCFVEDGLLVVEHGKIIASGDYRALAADWVDRTAVTDWRPGLIAPGFIDSHVHSVQTDMVASPAANLLDWLRDYTFPAEMAFADSVHAHEVAEFFVRQLLASGTTTAMVFGSSHKASVDALFSAAHARNLRLIAGKALMDRNAPAELCDSAQSGFEDSLDLIGRWHGKGRLSYAVTPRFVPTSSDAQLQRAAELYRAQSGIYMQSHVAENQAEVAWVRELYPWSRSYLDVYEHFGLLGRRAMYAHGIYLDATDRARLAERETALAFCPSSNLFLGSGLLDAEACAEAGMRLSLGSDVGAGARLDMFHVMQDGYAVNQLQNSALPPLTLWYLATLGGARALDIGDCVGSLASGYEADFIVLDWRDDAWLGRRLAHCKTREEWLFVLMMLGGQRTLRATYCNGALCYDSHQSAEA